MFSDTRIITCATGSALDDAGLRTDTEHSDATQSPPASTVLNSSSGLATDEPSQTRFLSDVSDDETNAMTMYTDGIEQGEPEPIVTRKEVMPVGSLLSVCTHGRY